ncbi:MAG: hypothetical protein AB8F78_06875 [Saprospiraceae bacterium]
MQLAILKDTLQLFFKALDKGWESGLEPLYETIPSWQKAWPPASPSTLAETIELSLSNQQTRGFWQGHAYFPKEVIIQFASFAPDMTNMAFGRLFNEDVELGDRFRGFNYYLDEVLGELRRQDLKKAPATHYHDDCRAPSLYCMCRFPSTHAYFEHDVYRTALLVLKAREVDSVVDATRFAKTVKVVNTFVAKDDDFVKSHLKRLNKSDFLEPAALIASEYFRFLESEIS